MRGGGKYITQSKPSEEAIMRRLLRDTLTRWLVYLFEGMGRGGMGGRCRRGRCRRLDLYGHEDTLSYWQDDVDYDLVSSGDENDLSEAGYEIDENERDLSDSGDVHSHPAEEYRELGLDEGASFDEYDDPNSYLVS